MKNKAYGQADKPIFARRVFIVTILMTTILCLAATIFLNLVIVKYKQSTTSNSIRHLTEINNQISLYVNVKMNDNWQVINTLKNSMEDMLFTDQDDVIDYITEEKNLWAIDNIYVVNEAGYSITDADNTSNKLPNDRINYYSAMAALNEYYFATENGYAIYALPLNLSININGKDTASIIILYSLNELVDNMHFSSFEDNATFYIANEKGIIISRLTNDNTKQVYDWDALFQSDDTTIISDTTLDEIHSIEKQQSFQISADGVENYVIVTITAVKDVSWKLIYIVPSDIVNKDMEQFSTYILVLCISLLVLLVALISFVFILIYTRQGKQLSSQLSIRELVLDSLVNETTNAFALIKIDDIEPLYVSANYRTIMKGSQETFSLTRNNGRMTILTKNTNLTSTQRKLLPSIQNWSGNREFTSPYISLEDYGSENSIMVKIYPTQDTDDEYIIFVQDVTEEKRREEFLKNALYNAESANVAKTKFLANMSHDIRTPMNAVINMTNIAMENLDNPTKARECLTIVKTSSDHLLKIINNVLDVSRIESGKNAFDLAPFNVMQSIDNIANIMMPLCAAKNQKFIVDTSSVKHVNVKGDAIKLEQALLNLLNNANKFTPNGGTVTFKIQEMLTLKSEIVSYRFIVSDTGKGISKDYIDDIFKPFIRANDEEHYHIEGTGLGLTITKTYIEGMGGTIHVTSAEGEGTTFVVELFFENNYGLGKYDQNAPNFEPLAAYKGLKVLLVEDNDINQMIASTILRQWYFDVTVVNNGAEAVSEFSQNDSYELIFMDLQMPVLDGYKATTQIRQLPNPKAKTVKIIAMTANVFADDVERVKAVGMDGHVGKPIDCNELCKTINKVMSGGKK